jgi:hypothetical protein
MGLENAEADLEGNGGAFEALAACSLDFIARLAALVPPPRINLTRYYGVFAPNSQHRALMTPSRRGKGNKRHHANGADDHTPIEHRAAMSWAQLVFLAGERKCRNRVAIQAIWPIRDA